MSTSQPQPHLKKGSPYQKYCEPIILRGEFIMTVPVKKWLDKIPGGIIIVPLFLGCLINTFFPAALQIGSFTTGIVKGTSALVGLFFVCMGAQLDLKCAPQAMKTGFTITIVKFAVSVAIGLLAARFFNNSLFGLSALAIIAAASNSNGALFGALTKTYGSESDQGAVAIISLNDGPFLTMVAMGTAGLASIPYMTVVASIVPLLLGIILGNLDPHMRKCLSNGGEVTIMVLGFALGANMSLQQVAKGGVSGIILGLITVFIGGVFNIFFDKLTGGSGIAGSAISSVGGNAVATPAALAAVDATLAETAAIATPQVAAAVVVTAIICPFMTNWISKRNGNKKKATFSQIEEGVSSEDNTY